MPASHSLSYTEELNYIFHIVCESNDNSLDLREHKQFDKEAMKGACKNHLANRFDVNRRDIALSYALASSSFVEADDITEWRKVKWPTKVRECNDNLSGSCVAVRAEGKEKKKFFFEIG